jgi:hypothetical protein
VLISLFAITSALVDFSVLYNDLEVLYGFSHDHDALGRVALAEQVHDQLAPEL